MILIVVKNPIRPKYADEFPKLVEEFTNATRAEPGCISFDWFRSVDDPNLYVQVEAFEDAAAGEAHVGSEHFKKAMEILPRFFAAIPEIVHIADAPQFAPVGEVS
jgi:quinol monooxygenase YgiN